MILALGACASVSVTTDHDKQADFSSYKTYAWLADEQQNSEGQELSPLMHQRIQQRIDTQMAKQGYNKVESNADLLINFSVLTKNKVDINTYQVYDGYAPGWYWAPGHPYGYRRIDLLTSRTETSVKEYTQGTLIIDFIDPASNQLVWRGMGSKRLPSQTTTEKTDELVKLVVESILSHFPPK